MPIDTQELMRQVGKIRVVTKRMVDDQLSGDYHSLFKGHGIEFSEVREYDAGDDIRSIDWNVTARMGHPYVKRYSEERELTVMFLVDVSGSQSFGSTTKTKAELSAEITSLLALTAIQNQDKIGLILFSDDIRNTIPPRKGRTAAMRLVREVLAAEETRQGTDITKAIQYLNRIQKRKCVVFLISDFMDDSYEQDLRVMARKHDVICCNVNDQREEEIPAVGLIEVEDPETGDIVLLDTNSSSMRRRVAKEADDHKRKLTDLFRRHNIDCIHVDTSRPYLDDIRKLFEKRQKRKRR